MKKLFAPVKEGKANMDEAAYKKIMKSSHENAKESLDLKMEYGEKMANVIGYKRVIDLGMAEKEFKKRLVERMKGSQPGKKGEMGKPNQRHLIEKDK